MASALHSIEQLKARIGVERKLGTYQIEPKITQRFLQTIDDSNPRWQDSTPSTLIPILGFDQIVPELLALTPALLHGSTELECYRPVNVGDKITPTSRLTNLRQLVSKEGNQTAFLTIEITYKNQHHEVVAKCRQVLIAR